MSVYLGWFAKKQTRIVLYAPKFKKFYGEILNYLLKYDRAIMVFDCVSQYIEYEIANELRQYLLFWNDDKNISGGLTHSNILFCDSDINSEFLNIAIHDIQINSTAQFYAAFNALNIKLRGV